MIANFDEVLDFVKTKYREAKDGSDEIVFPVEKYERSRAAINENLRGGAGEILAGAPSITDVPEYRVLKHSKGLSAWAAILSVDLRHSTKIAGKYGAEKTLSLMHTYLPTMAFLVEKAGGKTVGLRGDGLFAAFGVTELKGDTQVVDSEFATEAVRSATHSGKAMIEAMEDAIYPTLHTSDFDEDLRIGVGIDVGNVVITRIGLESACEVTAYGPAVNNACKKLASKASNQIRISKAAHNMYPTSKGGKTKFSWFDGGYSINFPKNFNMLGGDSNMRPGRPR